MAEFDLSSLPDMVLLKLSKMLPQSDRCSLASCNRRLAEFMNTPDLWQEVTLDLDTNLVQNQHHKIFVDRIRDLDLFMLERYSQHFQRVEVIMGAGVMGNLSLAELTKLCERNVIKSVSLRVERLISTAMNWQAENPSRKRPSMLMKTCLDNLAISTLEPGPEVSHLPASHLIDSLSPDADFTISFAPQSHNTEDFSEQGFDFYTDISYCTRQLLYGQKSERFCSLLKKLILSPLPLPEGYISMSGVLLSWWRRQFLPSPTAEQMARFPNLEELHVNIINLSDQLLLELSDTPGRRRPLRSLVIRHIACDCAFEGKLRYTCIPSHNPDTFPHLSSPAWDQLAKSSPSLTVECCVVSDNLPQLLRVIKPKTPLVTLKVLCRATSRDYQSVPVLQELSKNLSRLTIVGMRFRACTCTNAAL